MRPRSRTACFVPALLVLVTSSVTAASTARLLQVDPLTFHLVVRAGDPFRGGEVGIRFPGAVFVLEDVEAGTALPEDTADFRSIIHWDGSPASSCPADPALTAAATIVWVHPVKEGEAITLPGGEDQHVLTLRFSRGPGAVANGCAPIRFAGCLGEGIAPVRNVITDFLGRTRPLETTDLIACDSECRVVRFTPEGRSTCGSLRVEVREPGGAVIDGRQVALGSGNGLDAARAVLDDYRRQPIAAPGFRIGPAPSGFQLCRDGGAAFQVVIGEEPLAIGAPIGACGLDASIAPPTCPDRDLDGHCDADDCRPDVYDPQQDDCPSPGYCRRVKFDPLCAFRCDSLTFELCQGQPPVPIPGTRRTVTVAGDGTGLDVAVELCRAYRSIPPPGFRAHSTSYGCTLCRENGTPFSIWLEHEVEEAGQTRTERLEISTGGVVAACGLRIWTQEPGCPDADGDDVCDAVDRCPDRYDPSQADLDGDCAGDACQSGGEPFVPEGLCLQFPVEELSIGSPREISRTLTPCRPVECIRFKATPGKPVVLTLSDEDPASANALYLQWDRPASPVDHVLAAARPGSSAQRLVIPAAGSGTAHLRIQSRGRKAPSTVKVTGDVLDLALRSVSPAQGARGSRLHAVVRGIGFTASTSFRFQPMAGGEPLIPVSTIVLTPERAEIVLVIPEGAPLGHYELQAQDDDLEYAPFPAAFRVVTVSEATGLEVGLSFASFYRQGFVSRGSLRLRNHGKEEVLAPLVEISTRFTPSTDPDAPRGPTMTDLALRGEGIDLQTIAQERRRLLVLGGDPGTVASRLAPGASLEIPFAFRNIDPNCFSCSTTFEARLLLAAPGDAIDWDGLPVPEGLSSEDWDRLRPALARSLGGTWPEAHAGLAEIAARFGRRGSPTASARDVFRFACREALELPTAAAAGRLLDASTREPVAGAIVLALQEDQVVSFAETDPGGRFTVDWLENGASYRLAVNGRAGGHDIEMPAAGDLLGLTLELLPGNTDLTPICRPCLEAALPAEALFPPRELLVKAAQARITILGSFDPNEKDGPEGLGPDRLLGSDDELIYTIYFENKPTAGAAARRVRITDEIHERLDLGSLRLIAACIAGRVVHIDQEKEVDEADADSAFLRQPLRHLDSPGHADIDYELRVMTAGRTITWEFEAVDRLTGLPLPPETDPRRGFLPANRPRPNGEGWVSFAVKTRPGLDDDDPITNLALIRFDDNPTIVTEPVVNLHSLFLPAEPPRNPRPAVSDEPIVPIVPILCWERTPKAVSWDVFLWKVEAGGGRTPIELPLGLTAPCIGGFRLEHDTAYEWRVDARNIQGRVTPGDLWRFRTVTEPPPCPMPPIGLTVEPGPCGPGGRPAVLHWDPPSTSEGPVRYSVYLGTSMTSMARVATDLEVPRFETVLGGSVHHWRVAARLPDCPQEVLSPPGPAISGCLVAFIRGDADSDGARDITDGINILQFLFLGGPPPPCMEAADADRSSALDISDAIYLLTHLFLGGPELPAPNACGQAPLARQEDCTSFPGCSPR